MRKGIAIALILVGLTSIIMFYAGSMSLLALIIGVACIPIAISIAPKRQKHTSMKLIILDRDGVINQDSDEFIKSPDEFIPIPGSLEAISRLNQAGYSVIVATNQSGLARGLFSVEDLNDMHEKFRRLLGDVDGRVNGILYCPHGPDDNCDCRKPKPGLFKEVAQRYNTSLRGVPAVGDSLRDLEAALTVGAQPILVKTGKGPQTLEAISKLTDDSKLSSVPVYDNLSDYVDHLLAK